MLKLKGTYFQLKVWNYLIKIPKGKVKTYLEVAKAIGKPKAYRAVANAIGKNPFPIKIPCYRVIRSDGSLGGYSGKGGIRKKKQLLRSENIIIKEWFWPFNCSKTHENQHFYTYIIVFIKNNIIQPSVVPYIRICLK